MTTKCHFYFQTDDVLETDVADGVKLSMQRVGPAVARVSFVNAHYAEVEIPDGIRVHDNTNNVPVAPHGKNFFLCWTDDYTVRLGDAVVIDISNQRQWRIQGPPERAVRTHEM